MFWSKNWRELWWWWQWRCPSGLQTLHLRPWNKCVETTTMYWTHMNNKMDEYLDELSVLGLWLPETRMTYSFLIQVSIQSSQITYQAWHNNVTPSQPRVSICCPPCPLSLLTFVIIKRWHNLILWLFVWSTWIHRKYKYFLCQTCHLACINNSSRLMVDLPRFGGRKSASFFTSVFGEILGHHRSKP